MHLSLQDLANPKTAKQAGEMVERTLVELEELAAAPMLDEDYDGPILLLPEAASQLLATTVAPHATGEPAPLSDYGVIDELEPHWLDRLGKSVMPDWVDLIDDPTKPDGFGSYAVDADGVPAERIELVRGGVLANLLMSRRPNETIAASNGRLRATPALQTGPSISNLELVAKRRGLATKELERDLLRRAREDGYDFAYVIEAMRAHDVLGTVVRDSAMDYGAGRKVSMPIPGRVWRIDAKGNRTLVRGALLSPTSMRVLRRIRSVGRDDTTFPMRLTPGISGGFMAETGAEAMIGQTVDVSIRTPSLVVDGLELIVERGDNARLPILVHPLRRGAEAETQDAAGDAAASE